MKEGENIERKFIDVISNALRTKMACQGMITEEAWSESILGKMRPPEELRSKLSPLTGLCTYQLLDNLRYGECLPIDLEVKSEAGSIGEWFTDLKDTTDKWERMSQDSYADKMKRLNLRRMRFDQWKCLGDELISLDKATRVPCNVPETMSIFDAAKSIPDWVSKNALALLSKIGSKSIEVYPIGSFTCQTKVIDIDEFDFLLIYDCENTMFNFILKIVLDKLIENLDAESKAAVMAYWCHGLPNCQEPHITRVYKHGPAQCVELSWLCTEGHDHVLSVDMTFAKRVTTSLKSSCEGLLDKPHFEKLYKSISEDEKAVMVQNDFSTCTLDLRICEALGELSENIAVAFRLLKVVTHMLLPKAAQMDDSINGHLLTPCLSSHRLKQVLLAHVDTHFKPVDWSRSQLPLRMIELLQAINVGQMEKDGIRTQDPKNIGRKKIQKKANIKCDLYRKLLGVQYRSNIEKLKALLSNTDRTAHHDVIFDSFSPKKNIKLLFKLPGNDMLHPCNLDPYKLRSVALCSNATIYTLEHPDMVCMTHPIMQSCQIFVRDLFQKYEGPNLSQIDRTDFTELWILYTARILSKVDIQDERKYKCKVSELERLYEVFGNKCPVSKACQHALDQISVVDSVISAYKEEYWDPITLIPICLSKLTTREKAIVKGIAQRVVSSEYDLSGLEIEKFASLSESFQKIMISLQYLWAIQCRYYEGRKYCKDMMVGNCDFLVERIRVSQFYAFPLTFLLIWYIMFKNKYYLDDIQPRDTAWAKLFLDKIIDSDINCGDESEDDSWLPIVSNKSAWEVIRVEYDFGVDKPGEPTQMLGKLCFFRSIAVHGIAHLRQSDRLAAGMLLTFDEEICETEMAKLIQAEVEDVLKVVESPDWSGSSALNRLSTSKYPSMSGRLQLLLPPIKSAGFLEIAAVAYLARTQVHVYEDKCKSYVRTVCIPNKIFLGRPPICLLYTPGTHDQPGHYDLMIQEHIMEDLWCSDDKCSVFSRYASSLPSPEYTVSFNEIVEASINELQARSWKVQQMPSDELNPYRCVMNHLASSLEDEHRDTRGYLTCSQTNELENDYAQRMKDEAVAVLKTHESKQEVSGQVAQSADGDYCCMLDIIETHESSLMSYAGYLELAALSFLAKLQIHVYEDTDRAYMQTTVIAQGVFPGRPPISLLYTRGSTGHFDLLRPKHRLICRSDWTLNRACSTFARISDGASAADKKLSLRYILDPSKFSYGAVQLKKAMNVAEDGQSFFNCIKNHIDQFMPDEQRDQLENSDVYELADLSILSADQLRQLAIGILENNRDAMIKAVHECPFILAVTTSKSYNTLDERLAAMRQNTEPVGYLEIAAVAYLLKSQIFLYERREGDVVLLTKVAQENYKSNKEIHILYNQNDIASEWFYELHLPGQYLFGHFVHIVQMPDVNDADVDTGENDRFIDILDPDLQTGKPDI